MTVPVMMDLGCVIGLRCLFEDAEKERTREARSRHILDSCQSITESVYLMARSGKAYAKGGDESATKTVEDCQNNIEKCIADLRRQVSDNPDELALVERIDKKRRVVKRVLAEIRQRVADHDTMSAMALLAVLRKQGAGAAEQLETELRSIIDREKAIASRSPAIQSAQRVRLSSAFNIVAIANVLMACALMAVFNRQMSSRLAVLMANMHKLAKREPLLQRLEGQDELAELDRTFHETSAALQGLEKLKQEFVAMVSHDLRSPLASVQMLNQMLESGVYGQLTPSGLASLRDARASTDRLIKLVNELLDLEKLDAGAMELERTEVLVSDLFTESTAALAPVASARGITFEIEQDDMCLFADGLRLIQVMTNLLSNAIKFSDDASTIRIRAIADRAGFARVEVIDTGRGIPPEKINSVFEKFKQVERADATVKRGSGLGLPICKAIIELHGGTIGVTSESGKGSTFWFTVPILAEEASVEELASNYG